VITSLDFRIANLLTAKNAKNSQRFAEGRKRHCVSNYSAFLCECFAFFAVQVLALSIIGDLLNKKPKSGGERSFIVAAV
jgi:hypothetical protein